MKYPEIEQVAEALKQLVKEDEGILQIWQEGRHEDDFSISANQQGLLAFAAELLRAAANFPDEQPDGMDNRIHFENTRFFTDGDALPFFVRPINALRNHPLEAARTPGLGQKLMPFGCLAIVLFLLFTLITGLITIVGWMP